MGKVSKLPKWAQGTLGALVIWDIAWKGMALWRAARRQEPVWFVCLLVLNTAGILPIVYLLRTRGRDQTPSPWDADAQPDLTQPPGASDGAVTAEG